MAAVARNEAPHCLLIAFYFPPARASGVFRARALANHLVRQGWRVTVVAADAWFFEEVLGQADPSLLDTIDDRVRIVRVPFSDARFDRRIRFHSWFRGNFPRWAEQRMQRRSERRFPDPYSSWIDPVAATIEELHTRTPIDVLVATGNPFSSFEVARKAAEATAVPFVLDYRDAWTLDQFAEVEAFPPDSPVWRAEAGVIEGAARIVYVNAAQRAWYADRFPMAAGRMMVVENGYDPELLGPLDVDGGPGAPLRLGYVGTITRHLPWRELLAAWGAVSQQPPLDDAVVELYGYLGFFSHTADPLATLLDRDEPHARVSYRGSLPKERVGDAYRSLDVLLLVTPSSRYITCQKVYEYMAFGKPIVSVNEPKADARTPLREYPLSFEPERLEPSLVGQALERAAAAALERDPSLIEEARSYAERFTRERRMEEFRSLLVEVIGG